MRSTSDSKAAGNTPLGSEMLKSRSAVRTESNYYDTNIVYKYSIGHPMVPKIIAACRTSTQNGRIDNM